ncbi:MAG: hypothetical protein KME27_21110 [Lyngbya sp. HA4199-MV5]|nr:hypothetical protein [Lyngbya sp. HA4199-MV5]
MATATRQRSRATVVNQEAVGQASDFLQKLPEKPKEDLTLREAVGQMQESLKAALAKGYNYQDLAKMLSEKGIKISALTLKNYVPSGKRQAAKSKPRRSKRSVSDEPAIGEQPSAETVATTEPSVASVPEANSEATPAPTQPKRGRAKSSATKTAKSETNVKSTSTSAKTRRGDTKSAAQKPSKSEAIAKPTRTRKSTTAKAATKPATTKRRKQSST